MDKVRAFGLRSAPKLYNAVADTLLWILGGVEGLHYLDDILLFGDPNSEQCEQALRSALACCNILGVPAAHIEDKRSQHNAHFSWLGVGHNVLDSAPTLSQVGLSPQRGPAVARPQVLLQDGALIIYWSAGACMLYHQAREVFLQWMMELLSGQGHALDKKASPSPHTSCTLVIRGSS